uniref:Uncharacterized protein n=1 Tax=Arundo donax TaxID=35708 RepID=A0A0A8YXA1_ARUDO
MDVGRSHRSSEITIGNFRHMYFN